MQTSTRPTDSAAEPGHQYNRDLDARLSRIEHMLALLVERQPEQSWYTVAQFAAIVGRGTFTVRQWCNLGRIAAKRSQSRCGPSHQWVISHQELERYRGEGLLGTSRYTADPSPAGRTPGLPPNPGVHPAPSTANGQGGDRVRPKLRT